MRVSPASIEGALEIRWHPNRALHRGGVVAVPGSFGIAEVKYQ